MVSEMASAAAVPSPGPAGGRALSPVLVSLAVHACLLLLPLAPLLRGNPLPPWSRRVPFRAEAVFQVVPLSEVLPKAPERPPVPAAPAAPPAVLTPVRPAVQPAVGPDAEPATLAAAPPPASRPALPAPVPAPEVQVAPELPPASEAPDAPSVRVAPALPGYAAPPVLLTSLDPTAPALRSVGFAMPPNPGRQHLVSSEVHSAPTPPTGSEFTLPAVPTGTEAWIPAAPAASAVPAAQVTSAAVPTPGRTPARLLQRPAPPYPEAARREGRQGTVRLRLEIQPDGRVRRIEVAVSSGFPLLDAAAAGSARSWRFAPARENGHPVAEWRRVAVEFQLEDQK